MDTQMKIDAAVVKALREEKSWSQEHLASASGLSARTGWFGLSAGTVCSAAGILAGAVQGHLSPGEVGASLGLLGAFAGISAAILGVLDTWARRRGSAP